MFIPFETTAAVVPGLDFSDVNISRLTVGFEFEFISPISHKKFAQALSKKYPSWKIGVISSIYNAHEQLGAAMYNSWNITGDGSIDASPNEFGIELISPVLKLSQVSKILESVFSLLKALKCETNDSCGLHVTFGHPKITANLTYFNPLKFGVFLQEDKLLARFGRTDNGFSLNTSKEILYELHEEMFRDDVTRVGTSIISPWSRTQYDKETSRTGPKATDANLAKVLLDPRLRRRLIPIDHYQNISLSKIKNNLVEVRGMGGNYLAQSTTTLVNIVKHLARCLVISLSPTAYQAQYILAVKRMLNEYNPKDSEVVKPQDLIPDDIDAEYPTLDLWSSDGGRLILFGTKETPSRGDFKLSTNNNSSIHLHNTTLYIKLSIDSIKDGVSSDFDFERVVTQELDWIISICVKLKASINKHTSIPSLTKFAITTDNIKKIEHYFPWAVHLELPPDILQIAYIGFIQSSDFRTCSIKNRQYFMREWKAKVR